MMQLRYCVWAVQIHVFAQANHMPYFDRLQCMYIYFRVMLALKGKVLTFTLHNNLVEMKPWIYSTPSSIPERMHKKRVICIAVTNFDHETETTKTSNTEISISLIGNRKFCILEKYIVKQSTKQFQSSGNHSLWGILIPEHVMTQKSINSDR